MYERKEVEQIHPSSGSNFVQNIVSPVDSLEPMARNDRRFMYGGARLLMYAITNYGTPCVCDLGNDAATIK